jgi:hypothetical protein
MVRRSAAPLMDGSSPCLSLHRVDLGDERAAHASMGEGAHRLHDRGTKPLMVRRYPGSAARATSV